MWACAASCAAAGLNAPPPTPPFPPTHSSRPSGSQAASGPCFSCRSAGVTGSGVGDRSSASQSPSSLAALLCSPLPICLPARRFILSIAFSRCLAISSLAPLSCGLTSWTDTGGLCWKHFKPVFSLSRLVVRRLLSQPSAQVIGTCVLPVGVGVAFSGEFWKGEERERF